MAAMPEISVTVEEALHAQLTEWLNNVNEKHALCITDVRIDWLDVGNVGSRPKAIVRNVEITTRS